MLYRKMGKPVLDRMLGAVLAVVLAPLMVVLAALIRRRMGRPAIFRQTRIGLDDRPFEFCKFRTMTDERDASGKLLSDERRLTRLGRFLRSTSLDELPQLWNVLRGDMSLVGPRPLLPVYLSRYDAVQRRRHEVKPGITGLAQVSGRNFLSWEAKFERDVYYVDHLSAWLDLKILLKTADSVVRRTGISERNQATATEFMGSDKSVGRTGAQNL